MLFKIKQNKAGHGRSASTDGRGARCDQGSKLTADQLNNIRGEKYYTAENLKKMRAIQVCILAEYLLRLNDHSEKNGLRWFLSPVEAILSKIKE